MSNIRNFCIIAHIDHGKSTLADRILELTNVIPKEKLKPQILDSMDLERERGITIHSKTVRIPYVFNSQEYILNLIDTPGHVDFSYEVQRALIASEGALLVIDATQGVEAQTLANTNLAIKHNLKIIPIINKIDLPTANIQQTKKQIVEILNIADEPLEISAKEGIGIENVLAAIVHKIPPPSSFRNSPLKAIVFDSFYDQYRGVVLYIRVFDGEIKQGMKIVIFSSNKVYEVLETGILCFGMLPKSNLIAGEVGYIITGIKNIHDVQIGDTIIEKDKPVISTNSDLLEAKPFVWASFFSINPGEYDNLKLALEKLHLTDSSFEYQNILSSALGPGFHCGFLGSLHLDVVKERLSRDFNINLIVSSPNVTYRLKLKNSTQLIEISNPAKFPQQTEIEYVEEPYVKATIITPPEFTNPIIELCKNCRGKVLGVKHLDTQKVLLEFELPLSEIIFGFYDNLKSVSKGFASFDYEKIGYKKSELVKLEVVINREVIDAFAYIVHESKMQSLANLLLQKLKDTIPRHLFEIPIQIKVGNRIIARDDIKAYRKDVTAKLYGGDVTRKEKLLQKQKNGKKKMKIFGKVKIPQETFMALLKL